MSEQLTVPNPETIRSVSENYELAGQLVTPEAVEHRAQWLKDQMNGDYDPAMGHIGKLLERSGIQKEEAMQAWESNSTDGVARVPGEDMKRLYDAKIRQSEKTTELTYKTFGRKAIGRYRQFKSELTALQKDEHAVVEFHDTEANTVFTNLIAETQVIDDGIDREHDVPPTEKPGAVREDFEEYLLSKRFIDFKTLHRYSKKGEPPVRLFSENGFIIPTANVVSAGSFSDWRGRDGGSGDKDFEASNGKAGIGRSINAIIDYAERDTPLPPLEGVDAYIQPNGIVLFQTPNSNHRTAAHIARGEETMRVHGSVSIHRLEENLIEIEQAA